MLSENGPNPSIIKYGHKRRKIVYNELKLHDIVKYIHDSPHLLKFPKLNDRF